METSLVVARALSAVYLAFGLGMFFSRDYYLKELPKVVENPAYILLGGWMAIVLGSLLVFYHNIWSYDWTVYITLIGWIALIKGVILLIFPRYLQAFKPMFTEKLIRWVIVPICLLIGLVLGYFGFAVTL